MVQTKLVTAGLRLRKWRRAVIDKTQQDVANDLGFTSASAVSEIEKGRRAPTYQVALAIENLTRGDIRVEAWGYSRKTATRSE